MRQRSRHANRVIVSTRVVPIHRPGAYEYRRLVRRRRLRGLRTGALLAIVAVIRLVQVMRPRWRIIGALTGLLVEVVGFNVFSGGLQEASSVAGMALLLFALMKDAKRRGPRQVGVPAMVGPPPSS